MGFMKLLAAGRSFVGLKSDHTRYKVTPAGVVPDFSKKPGARGGKRAAQNALKTAEAARGGHVGTVGDGGAGAKAVAHATSDAKAPTVAIVSKGAKNTIQDRKRGPAQVGVAIGEKPPAVQAELRLQSVKVARNDLSDADLEVVPVGAPEKAGTAGFVKKLKMTRVVRTCLAWF